MDRGSLLNILATHGDKKFLARDGVVSTYSDLLASIEKVDGYFRGTILPGVCVALLGDYSIDSIACFIWLQTNKNIIVPVSVSAANEMTERCRTAHCEFLIDTSSQSAGPVLSKLPTSGNNHSLIERLREIQSAGLILFSSGSTGQPKAMIHDLDKLSEAYSNRKSRTLSLIIFLMFDHIGGVNTLLNSIYTGMFMVSPGNRDAGEVAKLIQKYSVSILPTSPTFLNLLLISDAPNLYDLSSLKFITYGTEPMPESLLNNLRTAFPNVRFQQTFGTSETGISRTDSKASGSLFMKFDDPDIEHSIVDGELWLRSKTQILGYLNHSMDCFTADGWFRTGDKVEVDDSGFIRIVGRISEIINVGGEKVFPAEIESVILELDFVEDCIVFGQPSPVTGQIVATKVKLIDGTDVILAKNEIRKYCATKLLKFKIPVKITFTEEPVFSSRFKKNRNV